MSVIMKCDKQLQFCKIIRKIDIYDNNFYGHIDYKTEEEDNEVLNLDANTPETQMQRAKRLGLKLDSDKVFENEKNGKSFSLPKVSVRRSKLNVYIPQAERERESISSARSSRNFLSILLLQILPNLNLIITLCQPFMFYFKEVVF